MYIAQKVLLHSAFIPQEEMADENSYQTETDQPVGGDLSF